MEREIKQDETRPAYYQFQIGDTTFDVFDLVRAIQAKRAFSFEEASALKYLVRLKKDTPEKRINDLQKAKECIDREIQDLSKNEQSKALVPHNVFYAKGIVNELGQLCYNLFGYDCVIYLYDGKFYCKVTNTKKETFLLATTEIEGVFYDCLCTTKDFEHAKGSSSIQEARELLSKYILAMEYINVVLE